MKKHITAKSRYKGVQHDEMLHSETNTSIEKFVGRTRAEEIFGAKPRTVTMGKVSALLSTL